MPYDWVIKQTYADSPTGFNIRHQGYSTWGGNSRRSFYRHRASERKPAHKRDEPSVWTSILSESWFDGDHIDIRGGLAFLDAANFFPSGYEVLTSVPWSDNRAGFVMNKARSSFNDEIHESAELALAFAERKKSADLIGERANSLNCFFGSLFKKKWRKAGNCLGIGNTRTTIHTLNRAHLEYDYGWKPMIGDMFNAAKVLESPYPRLTAKGTSSMPFEHSSSPGYGAGPVKCRHSAIVQADVYVDNPMLYKASQAGLINPLGVAWELVPFSFVVDWFLPIGDLLGQHSDYVGLDLVNAFHTHYRRYAVKGNTSAHDYAQPGTPLVPYKWEHQAAISKRFLGIPSVALAYNVYSFSATRAINALSLLLSTLAGRPKWLK